MKSKINESIENILKSYTDYGGVNLSEAENFPNTENVIASLEDICWLIFPGFKTAEFLSQNNLYYMIGERVHRLVALLTPEIKKSLLYVCNKKHLEGRSCFELAEQTILSFIEQIPEIRRLIHLDARAALNNDPAANTIEEIILSYPGLEAILVYRIAHFFYQNGIPIIPRIMSEHIHGKTGIDINPGAKIGTSFFIDHGTGIVIGETCYIGNNVCIYQGVTLGALSVKKALQDKKRHPTIEDNVVIYPNATILGGKTVIGKNSIIGGNVWVIESIPEGTTIRNKHVDSPK
ncbi:MAG: serine O-acetyltransferase EpsC [Treponemataceae bacterium]